MCSGLQQTKYLTQRSNVATCFFYIPTISTNNRYENLAQVLAQQMKPLISPILMILTPRKPLHS